MVCKIDLIIIGGGPAGLSAAINAASEGLSVTVLDSAAYLGGQARESNAIENYLGFPNGVTGEQLMTSAVLQARKFGNITFNLPASVLDIQRDDKEDTIHVTTEDYQEYVGRAVLLSNGLSYRRLGATNIGSVMGRGVYYGAPVSVIPKKKCNVAIVGGANSAGQAAVKLSQNRNANIKMYIRGRINDKMSAYLVNRIRDTPNIEVCEGCEVTCVQGEDWLDAIDYSQRTTTGDKTQTKHELTNYMFIFIGAQPRTLWLRNRVQLDSDNYVLSGTGVHVVDKNVQPLFMETSMRGVFVAGDVRANSTKRIAAAIGEGSTAVAMIHQHLASMK